MAYSDAVKRAQRKYNASLRAYTVRLRKVEDEELIKAVEAQENKTEFFRECIRSRIGARDEQ